MAAHIYAATANVVNRAKNHPYLGGSVILYGPAASGKSHIAQALGHLAVRHGAEVRFLKTTWPAGTPTGPGTSGWPSSPARTCSYRPRRTAMQPMGQGVSGPQRKFFTV